MSQKQSNSNNTVSISSSNIDIVLGFASDTSTSENSQILVSFDLALPFQIYFESSFVKRTCNGL